MNSPYQSFFVSLVLLFCQVSLAETIEANGCANTVYQGSEKVPERLLPSMSRITQAYCKAGGKRTIAVNSGIRTADHQARLMARCLRQKSCGYYANQDAVVELQAVYEDAPAGQKINAVAEKIREQIHREQPCYVSKHLTAYGLDLERWHNSTLESCQIDLEGDDAVLANVLDNSDDVANVIYKEASGCTHFHVNFIGWDQIPGLKRCSKPNSHE